MLGLLSIQVLRCPSSIGPCKQHATHRVERDHNISCRMLTCAIPQIVSDRGVQREREGRISQSK